MQTSRQASKRRVTIAKKIRDIHTLRGIVRGPRRRAVTVRQMNRAIADGYAGVGR